MLTLSNKHPQALCIMKTFTEKQIRIRARRDWQFFKFICSVVALAPLLFLPTPKVLADIPDPYTNCAGDPITPTEYMDLMVAFNNLDTNFYQQLFIEPFDYCGEVLTLDHQPQVDVVERVINGELKEYWPTVQESIYGERLNQDYVCESFTFELVEFWPYDVDDVVWALAQWDYQLDPDTEATLRAGNYINGPVWGIIHAPLGDMNVFGHVISVDLEGAPPGERRTQLILSSEILEDELVEAYTRQQIISDLAYGTLLDPMAGIQSGEPLLPDSTDVYHNQAKPGGDPNRPPAPGPAAQCHMAHNTCYGTVQDTYYSNIDQSRNNYHTCLLVAAIAAAVAAAVCIFTTGFVGTLGCLAAAAVGLVAGAALICRVQQRTRDQNHLLTANAAFVACERALELCLAQINQGNQGL
ncbi:MAG: hypothetical protein KAY37_01155 [Phycisphaerae bacterium]|nr:hypothetical protein [Phycisphaerae bacterium]